MNRYIQQLIEDFDRAGKKPVPEINFGESYEEFEKQMHEIEEGKLIPAKEKIGVSYEELPPVEKMTDEQTQNLLEAMLNALSARGTDITFPGDGIPVKLAYTELRNHFKEGFHSIPGWVIDFCSGWCPDCAFVDYCSTKDDIWTKDELEKEKAK
ncbi:MAG: hypothetical protein L3J74_16640 [Bacteroidales bacterium]|nr:hypothetical protein [Bacteroidales bacterium]